MPAHIPRKTFVFYIKKNGQVESTIVKGDGIRNRKIIEVTRRGRATCSFDSRSLLGHQEFDSDEEAEKHIERFEFLREHNLLRRPWGEHNGGG